MKSEFIVDVNESDFEFEVLAYSVNKPVVVDFWATWCAPCRVLGPLLEKLANEFQGSFRLAKVDVDQNSNLATKYNVRSIPTVKVFREGKLVSEFSGALPEPRLRELLANFAPSQDALLIDKGKSLLNSNNSKEAELVFRQILVNNPSQPAANLGLMKSYLQQGRGKECLELYPSLPASRELASAEILRPVVIAFSEEEKTLDYENEPLQASFQNAIKLAKRGNLEAAMDGILDILRQEKNFRNGYARKVFLGFLELLGDESPVARNYRAELASVLF